MRKFSLYPDSKRALKHAQKLLDQWLESPEKEAFYHRCRLDLSLASNKAEPENMGDYAALLYLNNFLASRAVQAILRGEDRWQDIHQSWLHKVLFLRITMFCFERAQQHSPSPPPSSKPSWVHRLFSRSPQAPPEPPRPPQLNGQYIMDACRLWTYAVCCGRQREMNYFGRLISTFFPNESSDWQAQRHLEPLCIWLWQKQQTRNGPVPVVPGVDYGPYRAIIDHWEAPEQLPEAIAEACDFHCQRMYGRGFMLEFMPMPYTFVPAEILAIGKIRAELGLATPAVEHPLLQTPCAVMHGSPDAVQDELLEKIEAKLAVLWPQIKNPIIPW